MKYIKMSLLTIALFFVGTFAYVGNVSAEPHCAMTDSCSSGSTQTPGGSAQTAGDRCKKNPAGPGCDTYNSGISPTPPKKDKTTYDNCINQCNNSSNADKTLCKNSCGTPPTDGSSSNTDTGSTAKPTPSPEDDENFFKPLGGEGYVCNGIMSDALLQEIIKIYRTISLIMVVAVIIFGMLDFFKAITGGDADSMKKASKKFMNRIIIVIIIVLLPIILKYILSIFGDSRMTNCLDKIKL